MIKFSKKAARFIASAMVVLNPVLDVNAQNPQVINIPAGTGCSPRTNSTDVINSSDANVVFDMNMQTAGWMDNIAVHSNYRGHLQYSGGVFTHPYSGDQAKVNFNPTNNFFPGELVNVIVKSGMAVNNNALQDPKSFSFTAATASANAVFTAQTNNNVNTHKIPTYIISADFDNDGNIDVATMESSSWVYIIKNTGGNISVASSYNMNNGLSFGANSLATFDYDMDGDIDIVGTGTGGIRILKNNGGFNFSLSSIFGNSTGFLSTEAVTHDFNNDGWYDVAALNSGGNLDVFPNNSGVIGQPYFLPVSSAATDLVAGDFDNDGWVDLVYPDPATNQLHFIRNTSTNSSISFQAAGSFSSSATSQLLRVAAIDADNDFDLDIIALYGSGVPASDNVVIFRNNGTGTFAAGASDVYTTQSVIRQNQICVSDYDGDGDMDFVIASHYDLSNQIEVFINDGFCGGGVVGDFTPNLQTTSNTLTDPEGFAGITTADFNNDGKMDLAGAINIALGYTHLILNGGSCSMAGNTPPTICPIANQDVCKSATTVIPFCIDDVESLYGQLSYSVSCSDPNFTASIAPVGVIGANDPGAYPMALSVTNANVGVGAQCTITITVTDGNGTQTILSFVVTVNSGGGGQVQVSITNNPNATVCPGSPVTLTANVVNGGGAPFYQWAIWDGVNYVNVPGANSSTFVFTPPAAPGVTSYNIGVWVVSNLLCVTDNPTFKYTKVSVHNVEPFTIDPQSATICQGECVNLDAQNAVSLGYQGFIWAPNYGITINNGSNVEVCPPATTVYSVTATDQNGCTYTATSTVTVMPNPMIQPGPLLSPPNNTGWNHCYGFDKWELAYSGQAFRATDDGGFVYAVNTKSSAGGDIQNGPISGNSGADIDILFQRYDQSRNLISERRFGGTEDDEVYCIKPSVLGGQSGYVMVGSTASASHYPVMGGKDIYIAYLDLLGSPIWERTYGGNGDDVAYSVEETFDGYVLVGKLSDGIITKTTIIKFDHSGNLIWEQNFPYPDYSFFAISKADYTDFIIAGDRDDKDFYLQKINYSGNTIWSQTYSIDAGSLKEAAYSVKQTYDGGYAFLGVAEIASPDFSQRIFRTDDMGSLLWDSYAGDWVAHARITPDLEIDYDNGYLIGSTEVDPSFTDYRIFKFDDSGNQLWTHDVTGNDVDLGLVIRRTSLGIMMGMGATNSTDFSNDHPSEDVLVFELKFTTDCGSLFPVSTVCQGGSLTSIANIPAGATNIVWTNDGVVIGNQPILTYTFLLPDNPPVRYNVIAVSFEYNGCHFSCSQDMEVLAGATADAGSDQTTCPGGTVNLLATGSGPYFLWSNGVTTAGNIVSPTSTTTYTVTVTNMNGCTASDQVVVNVTNMTVSAGSNQTVCSGATVNLLASVTGNWPNPTYQWSNGISGAGNSVSPLTTTTYTVTATSGVCTATASVTITTNPLPVVNVTSIQGVSCVGLNDGGVTFTVTNSSSYNYSIPGTTITGTGTGTTVVTTGLEQNITYTIIVIDQSQPTQCQNNTSFTVGYGGPQFSVCASALPCGTASGDVTINFNVTRQNPPTSDPYTYTVTENTPTGNIVFSTGNGTLNTNEIQIVPGLNAGQTYYVNVTDNSGCLVSSPFTVQTLQFFATTNNDFPICNSGSTVEISPLNIWSNATSCTAIPTIGFEVIIKKKDNNSQYTIQVYSYSVQSTNLPVTNPNLPVLGIGEYEMTVGLTGITGCTIQPFYFTVSATSPIVVDVQTVMPLCYGGEDGSATANVTGGSGTLTYEWYQASPAAPSTPLQIIQPPLTGNGYTITGLEYGNYAVVVTDPNSGCTTTQPVFFTVEQPLEFEIQDPPGCTSSACSASVSVQGGTPGYTFSWQLQKVIEGFTLEVLYNGQITPVTTTDPLQDPLNGYNVVVYDENNPQQPPYNPPNAILYNSTYNTATQFIEVFVDHVTPAPGVFEGTSTYNNPEPGIYQIIATDANGCSFLVCTLEVEHPATPRTYDICFNWKTRSTEETTPSEPAQTFSLAALAASDISQAIDNAVQECIVKQTSSITQGMLEMCNKVDYLEDELSLTYKLKQQHYTLYYYDRAGNLVRTVPPAGFVAATDRVPTTHGLVTKYHYNSLAQLSNQNTPDGGTTRFIYNDINQLLYSQNAEQLALDRHPNEEFSYTRYDALGRIIEVGKSEGTFSENLLTAPTPVTNPSQQTFTVYSDASSNITYQGQMQRYLQNRVSYSQNIDNNGNSNFTYYSYDPHGNVEWLVQDAAGFGKSTIAYDYDLISNKVLKVKYNEGRIDQFYHRYRYDEDNRILGMETSRDGYLWDNDASYNYYLHGPLKRTEIGHDKIQGIDYTYTIQGWLKGINSPHLSIDPILSGNIDYGNDGTPGSLFAPDEFGMALGYFEGDFKRTGTHTYLNSEPTNVYYLPASTASSNGSFYAGNLYNGNISTWVSNSSTQSVDDYTPALAGEQYTYDRLNRIKSSRYSEFNGGVFASNNAFDTKYSYDANGNILTLKRNGSSGALIDDLSYEYNANSNQLNRVNDAETTLPLLVDIESGQNIDNYRYDKIGNLIGDEQEELGDLGNNIDGIKWTVYGKIAEVIPKNNSANQKFYLKFTYDATGNRLAKHVIEHPYSDALLQPQPGQTTPNNENFNPVDVKSTYYMRDASGNIMAIYQRTNTLNTNTSDGSIYYTAHFKQIEVDLYGSDRVGTYNPHELVIGSVDFLPDQFYNVSLNFDDFNRVTEFIDPFTNSHKDDYFDTDINNPDNILISTAAINTIDLVTPDITSKVEFLGVTDNAITKAETDEPVPATVFYAAGANYWGASNTLLVYDKDNSLMMGSSNIITSCDEKSKPVIVQKPGVDSKIYYLFTRDISGALFYYTVDMDQVGNGDASNKLGEIMGAPQLLSSAICGRHIAVIEDNVNHVSYVYYTEHNATPHETHLKRMVINQLGTYLIEDLITYESYDENGDGEIQIALDGSSLTIYNHLLNLGWFNASEAEIRTYKLNNTYGIAYAANVQNNNAWEPQVRQFALPVNNCPKGTFDYSADGEAVNIAQTFVQNIFSPTQNKVVYTIDLGNLNDGFLINEDRVGDIRHLASASSATPNYHFEKGGVNLDGWVSNAIFTHPDPGSTTTVIASLGTDKFLDGALAYQPHKVFARTLNELVVNRIVGRKSYELKDHLGNIRVTFSDAKQGPSLAELRAEIQGVNNYYPFGMMMPGRNAQAGYRFGFNGKEMDNEVSGTGNQYDYGFRIYNPRIGKFLSVDPLTKDYPWYTPYQFAGNKPIHAIDLDGLEETLINTYLINNIPFLKVYSYVEVQNRAIGHTANGSGEFVELQHNNALPTRYDLNAKGNGRDWSAADVKKIDETFTDAREKAYAEWPVKLRNEKPDKVRDVYRATVPDVVTAQFNVNVTDPAALYASLSEQEQQSIQQMAITLYAFPNLKAKIEGSASSSGTPEKNQQLAQARANSMLEAIITTVRNAGATPEQIEDLKKRITLVTKVATGENNASDQNSSISILGGNEALQSAAQSKSIER